MPTDLPALLARVEAATGGDREIDAAIALTFQLPQHFFAGVAGCQFDKDVDGPDYHVDKATWSGMGERYSAPPFTTSLDATVALVEKLRPGEFIKVCGPFSVYSSKYPRPWQAMFDNEHWDGHGHTEALARLAALLRSMIEEEGK